MRNESNVFELKQKFSWLNEARQGLKRTKNMIGKEESIPHERYLENFPG